ncbi:hypothetical protein BDZ89DRAFT_1196886 [Hymenopellis radicata]|nr:hypothetical protein BDZ89DRAFT_1196886 [Hymenopellis radicata]
MDMMVGEGESKETLTRPFADVGPGIHSAPECRVRVHPGAPLNTQHSCPGLIMTTNPIAVFHSDHDSLFSDDEADHEASKLDDWYAELYHLRHSARIVYVPALIWHMETSLPFSFSALIATLTAPVESVSPTTSTSCALLASISGGTLGAYRSMEYLQADDHNASILDLQSTYPEAPDIVKKKGQSRIGPITSWSQPRVRVQTKEEFSAYAAGNVPVVPPIVGPRQSVFVTTSLVCCSAFYMTQVYAKFLLLASAVPSFISAWCSRSLMPPTRNSSPNRAIIRRDCEEIAGPLPRVLTKSLQKFQHIDRIQWITEPTPIEIIRSKPGIMCGLAVDLLGVAETAILVRVSTAACVVVVFILLIACFIASKNSAQGEAGAPSQASTLSPSEAHPSTAPKQPPHRQPAQTRRKREDEVFDSVEVLLWLPTGELRHPHLQLHGLDEVIVEGPNRAILADAGYSGEDLQRYDVDRWRWVDFPTRVAFPVDPTVSLALRCEGVTVPNDFDGQWSLMDACFVFCAYKPPQTSYPSHQQLKVTPAMSRLRKLQRLAKKANIDRDSGPTVTGHRDDDDEDAGDTEYRTIPMLPRTSPPPPPPASSAQSQSKASPTKEATEFAKFTAIKQTIHRLYHSGKVDARVGDPATTAPSYLYVASYAIRTIIPSIRSIGHMCGISSNGFFVKKDISCLHNNTYAINLSHCEGKCLGLDPPAPHMPTRSCPCSTTSSPDHSPPPTSSPLPDSIPFTIVDPNGIHATRVRFCHCSGDPDRVAQLMKLGLFPATSTQPETAFTFAVMRQHQQFRVRAKVSTHDFVMNLAFATDTHFPYNAKEVRHPNRPRIPLPSSPAGNMVIMCPACPEDGINMEDLWRLTPDELVHITRKFREEDGNFHLCHYKKSEKSQNLDPPDPLDGRGPFPSKKVWEDAIKLANNIVEEKSTCNYLRAVNMQNTSKFYGKDISGVVAVSCAHTLLEAIVDLTGGEKYTLSDLAHALALNLTRHDRPPGYLGPPEVKSYDCALPRFKRDLPHLVPEIERLVMTIPAVHVHNHQESCMYVYSAAYVMYVGHFYGENTEQPWVHGNQLAPMTSQMNRDNRQLVLAAFSTMWNELKIIRMPSHPVEKIETWDAMERVSKVDENTKKLTSVYRQTPPKMPTKDMVLGNLLNAERKDKGERLKRGLQVASDSPASLINLAFDILDLQRVICDNEKILSTHPTDRTRKDLDAQRKKLGRLLRTYHTSQQNLMADALRYLQSEGKVANDTGGALEKEPLHLPSSFTAKQRKDLNLLELAKTEGHLRLGLAHSLIIALRDDVKTASLLKYEDHRERSVAAHTRSQTIIRDVQRLQDAHLRAYNDNRDCMVLLAVIGEDDEHFLKMTPADLFRKKTAEKRPLGATHMDDGSLWTRPSQHTTAGTQDNRRQSSRAGSSSKTTSKKKAKSTNQRGSKGKHKRKDSEESRDSTDEDEGKQEGWVWTFRGKQKWTKKDIEAWSDESDRVQWFRAEAEMNVWLHDWEIKQADCVRFLSAMDTFIAAWTALGDNQDTDDAEMSEEVDDGKEGFMASARFRASVCQQRRQTLRSYLIEDGYEHLLHVGTEEEPLYAHLQDNRADLSDALQRCIDQRKVRLGGDESNFDLNVCYIRTSLGRRNTRLRVLRCRGIGFESGWGAPPVYGVQTPEVLTFVTWVLVECNLKYGISIPDAILYMDILSVSTLVEDLTPSLAGDRVCANLTLDHIHGDLDCDIKATALWGPVHGVLTQYRAFPPHSLMRVREHLSYEEASTLPCVALTAYNALTGKVNLGLQLAVASGATVIAASSSDQNSAKHVINYNQTPAWDEEELKLMGGHGSHLGGPGTPEKSAIRFGGSIHLIGFLALMGLVLLHDFLIPPQCRIPAFLIPAALLGFVYRELAIGYLNTGRDLRRMGVEIWLNIIRSTRLTRMKRNLTGALCVDLIRNGRSTAHFQDALKTSAIEIPAADKANLMHQSVQTSGGLSYHTKHNLANWIVLLGPSPETASAALQGTPFDRSKTERTPTEEMRNIITTAPSRGAGDKDRFRRPVCHEQCDGLSTASGNWLAMALTGQAIA